MNIVSMKPGSLVLLALLAAPLPASLSAQEVEAQDASKESMMVYGSEGPKIEGIITARSEDSMQITTAGGATTVVAINEDTEVKGTGGFLGLNRKKLGVDMLLNGLPVTVETWQSGDLLLASAIKFKNKDLNTAAMIRNGTAQRFAEHDTKIATNAEGVSTNAAGVDANARAAEALRGRLGDIDQYNIKGVTNVFFDTGRWQLSPSARQDLCTAAGEADAIDNSLLLVVGYTDSTGSYEVNQTLSEKRAGRVVNFLQQECGWKPFRMLTPTGMAASDPLVSNDTAEGRAQNRRVSVNILVSKALDGM